MEWLAIVIPTLLFAVIHSKPHHQPQIGYFWQVTDFHYDANYTLHGDPSRMCHLSASGVHYSLGQYGDYRCDSPWSLVKSAVDAMSDIHPNPDFVLWTGDSVPHVSQDTYNQSTVFSVIGNVTNYLLTKFPNISILPSFGNHDPYPSNQMPVSDEHYYSSILNVSHWDQLLSANVTRSFLKGGYYSLDISKHIKIICLNTALYYSMNNITKNKSHDPSGQLSWLASQLEHAHLSKRKVYIAAHVPPGTFELAPTYKWFHADFNKAYIDVIDDFSDIIIAHFYGHEHTDSFRVFDGADGDSPMFLSPAVTPWKSPIPGVGYNNPSVRLYKYDKISGYILDYYQYYLNLTKANTGDVSWLLEYSFTKAYNVPDVQIHSVRLAAQNILNGDKIYLNRYLAYNSVSAKSNISCDHKCKLDHKCSIHMLRYENLDRCLDDGHHKHSEKPNTTNNPSCNSDNSTSWYLTWTVLIVAVSLLLVMLSMMIFCLRHNRYMLIGRGHTRFPSYNSYSYGTISSYSN